MPAFRIFGLITLHGRPPHLWEWPNRPNAQQLQSPISPFTLSFMNHRHEHALHSPCAINRRRLLQAGGLGCLGFGLGDWLQAEAASANHIRSCILIFYYGGPSQLDTWDLKPDAPAEIRGEFRPIATRVPGMRISEHLPRCARITDKLAVIRSMHHPMRNHNAAAVEALCGRTPLGGDQELLADDANSFPCYGSALRYLERRHDGVPSHVALPHLMRNVVTLPGQNAGFLGAAFNPFQINHNPNNPDFRVAELELPADLPLGRIDERRALLNLVDRQIRRGDRLQQSSARDRVMSAHQQAAFDLLRSREVREAFDLTRENERHRDRYGRTTLGQSMLLARRLVEAGVRFVNVNDKIANGQLENWDSHENNFPRLKDDLLPPADQAFSALIEDLEARGLLESTLVVGLAEFGRTPRINGTRGRDHWPDCFSVVLAGGGVRGGLIHGASDRFAAYPARDPVTPGDLAATIFWRFGIDPATPIRDLTNRPYRLGEGEPLAGLFA